MANRYRSKKAKDEYKSALYNGNVAYEFAPAYEPQPVEKIPEPSPIPYERPYHREKAERRKIAKHNFKLICSVVVVFAGCLVTMVSYASVTEQRVTNSRLKEELAAMQSENTAAEAEITGQLNLDYVANEAKGRLGMTEPQPYQVVYIEVPKQSYTVQFDTESAEADKGFSINSILDIFKKD